MRCRDIVSGRRWSSMGSFGLEPKTTKRGTFPVHLLLTHSGHPKGIERSHSGLKPSWTRGDQRRWVGALCIAGGAKSRAWGPLFDSLDFDKIKGQTLPPAGIKRRFLVVHTPISGRHPKHQEQGQWEDRGGQGSIVPRTALYCARDRRGKWRLVGAIWRACRA